MTDPGGTRAVRSILLLAAALSTAACNASPAGAPSSSTSTGTSTSQVATSQTTTRAEDAKTILHRTFTGRESLGAGSGQLQSLLGNTLARTPDGVLSVTFAFVCTGGGSATVVAIVDGSPLGTPDRVQDCDGSVLQQSIEVPRPAAVGFTGTVTESGTGTFAYGYYSEKKQLG